MIAISAAVSASAGILVKDRLALERMRSIDTALFDQTGTLTKGAHAVTGVAGAQGFDEAAVLTTAAAIEADSEHPLARAIVSAARDRGEIPRASGFRALAGRGVTADIRGTTYAVDGPAVLRQRGLAVPELLRNLISDWERRGASARFAYATRDESSARNGEER